MFRPQILSCLLLALFAFTALASDLDGLVVGISDGDTITVLDSSKRQHKVRLVEIDTPESGQPWGSRAKQALANKIFREEVTVRTQGKDRYGRVLGRIYFDDRDINRELVAEGHAWVYRQYMTDRSLLKDEAKARKANVGLWGLSEPVPPWEWRRGDRTGVARQVEGESDKDFACRAKQYCGEMTSCAEAISYLEDCGLSRLDGDGDGVPCESLCR